MCNHLRLGIMPIRVIWWVYQYVWGIGNAAKSQTSLAHMLKSSRFMQRSLLGLAFLGICAMISDGILVPDIGGTSPAS